MGSLVVIIISFELYKFDTLIASYITYIYIYDIRKFVLSNGRLI